MMDLNELPMNVQEEVKEKLKAFAKVTVWFENGGYTVATGAVVKTTYAQDEEFVGEFKAEDIFTETERMINYIETFHDYPAGYKGKRDYQTLDKIGNDWSVKFKMENGNLVLA